MNNWIPFTALDLIEGLNGRAYKEQDSGNNGIMFCLHLMNMLWTIYIRSGYITNLLFFTHADG